MKIEYSLNLNLSVYHSDFYMFFVTLQNKIAKNMSYGAQAMGGRIVFYFSKPTYGL